MAKHFREKIGSGLKVYSSEQMGIIQMEGVTMTTEIDLLKIIFRQDLYPRIEHDPQTVQSYSEDSLI